MVRLGNTCDVDEIVSLALEALSKSPYKHIPPDKTQIRRSVILSIIMPSLCCFVSERDGEITGALVGIVSMNVWGAFVASDNGIYSKRPGEGIKLIDNFFSWAKRSGAQMINITNSYGDERFDRFLLSRGLKCTGGNFIGDL